MPASVGTVWVDVRFNVGDVGRQLQAAIAQASRTAVPGGGGPGGDLERGVTSSFARIGAAAAQTGRQMTFAVSAPLALIGKSAVSAFAAFDSEMTKINALVGVSRSQTTGWAEDVKNLSRQYGIAADASAGALYFITSSGIEGSKAIETLEVATKGAAVGLGDVQTVADATTSAMNAYGQENMSAAKAADILTVAVREGKGEADQMAGALSAVIPIASAVGVSYGEIAGAMSAMTLSGTSADEAATQLRALLNTLQDMPPISQKALKQYTGLDYAMVRNKLTTEGLIPTLQQISEAFGDNQVAVAEVFGNIRALTGIQNLFGEKTQQTLSIVEQTTNAQGDLNKAFDITSQSASFKLTQAMNDLKVTFTDTGAAIIPMATAGATAVSKLAEGFAALDAPLKDAAIGLSGLLVISGPLMYAFGSLASMGTRMNAALTSVSPGFANFKAGVSRSVEAVNENSRANNGLVSQLGGVNQILGATAIAIGGVVAAQQIWNATLQDAERIGRGFVKSIEAMQTGAKGFQGAQEQIDLFDAALKQVADELNATSDWNPFDKKKREQLRQEWKQTMEARDALGKYMETAGKMAGITNGNRDAMLDWLIAQKAADKEYPDATAAVNAYNAAVKAGEPAALKAASATNQATNALSGLIAKAKDASDKYGDLRSAQRGYRDAQQAVTDAEQKVGDAVKAVADAHKATLDAETKITDARRKAVDAANSLADANQRLVDAQNELNQARQGPSEEEKIDVESPKLSLREAKERLRQPFDSSTDRQRARLDERRAQLELTRVEGEHATRLADAEKGVVDAQKGVADARQNELDANAAIVSATDARAESVEREKRAIADVGKARQDLVDAQEDVLPAFDTLTRARQDLAGGVHSGPVNGQAFIDYLNALKAAEPGLSGTIDAYIADFNRLRKENEKPDPYGGSRPPSDRLLNRATGGPVGAGQLSTVNERGMPELWTANGKQYLLPVNNGRVTPLAPLADVPVSGGDSPAVGEMNVYVNGDPVQNAYEVRRQLRSYTGGRR